LLLFIFSIFLKEKFVNDYKIYCIFIFFLQTMMNNNDSDKSNKNKQKQIQMTEKSNTQQFNQSSHNSYKNRHYRYKKQIKNDHTKRESIGSHQVHHTTQTHFQNESNHQVSTSSDNQNENNDDYEDHIIFIHDDDTKEEEPPIYSIRLSQLGHNNQPHNQPHNQTHNQTHNQPHNQSHNQTHNQTHNQSHNQSHNQPEFKDGECQSEDWDVICCKLDKNCIVYFSQLGLVTLCVCVSLYQIVSGGNNNRDFFIALLSSSLGYVLPAPTLKKK